MTHCSSMKHAHHAIAPALDILGLEGSGLVIAAFLTGLAVSLTHCIGMCGPFALMQLNTKLMSISADQISQKKKLQLAIFMPYYLGKWITYCLIVSIIYLIPFMVIKSSDYNTITLSLLSLAAIFFILEGISQFTHISFSDIINKNFASKISKLIKLISSKHVKSYGLLSGIILGFLPCGILYISLASIAALSPNFLIAIAATSGFAIATIPGLFISAYLGNYCTSKLKNKLKWVYALIMILNGILIFKYSAKLL